MTSRYDTTYTTLCGTTMVYLEQHFYGRPSGLNILNATSQELFKVEWQFFAWGIWYMSLIVVLNYQVNLKKLFQFIHLYEFYICCYIILLGQWMKRFFYINHKYWSIKIPKKSPFKQILMVPEIFYFLKMDVVWSSEI